VYFSIGQTTLEPEIDLTRMQIVFSTPGSDQIILTQGTSDTTSTFTTMSGDIAVTSLGPHEEVEIRFRVKTVTAGSKVQIDVKPPAGTLLPILRTVPAMLSSVNILQ